MKIKTVKSNEPSINYSYFAKILKFVAVKLKWIRKWAIPEKNQTGGWGYGISRGIKEMACGISKG